MKRAAQSAQTMGECAGVHASGDIPIRAPDRCQAIPLAQDGLQDCLSMPGICYCPEQAIFMSYILHSPQLLQPKGNIQHILHMQSQDSGNGG